MNFDLAHLLRIAGAATAIYGVCFFFRGWGKREGLWSKTIGHYDLYVDICALGALTVLLNAPIYAPEAPLRLFLTVFVLVGVIFFVGLSAHAVFAEEITIASLVVFGLRLFELILFFSAAYRLAGISGPGGRAETFGACLYFSVITITTVGYGDLVPLPQARVFAAFEALTGYVYMALFIAAVNNLLSRKPPPSKS
jgi:hypothetical protein